MCFLSQEYCYLKFAHFNIGAYSQSHRAFPGMQYLEIDASFASKTNALTVSNPCLLVEAGCRHVVLNSDDDISPLKLFRRIKEHCDPRQEYIFCHVLSKAQKKTLSGIKGQEHIEYNWQRRMGITSISKFCRVLNQRRQIPGVEECTNHTWRSWMVTRMNNKKGVSMAAKLAHSRHRTPQNQLAYDRENEESEVNLQVALQEVPIPNIVKSLKCPKKENKKKISTQNLRILFIFKSLKK